MTTETINDPNTTKRSIDNLSMIIYIMIWAFVVLAALAMIGVKGAEELATVVAICFVPAAFILNKKRIDSKKVAPSDNNGK